ncbi:cupin domain-containing protein [Pleomorphomonas sp. JP5]|uniref:cupin domain-containing protein n=1 Tax=Pleomorphomonas sp. JP5 TaxID=2942998 RepID=UPI002042D484|nr:cupin domain-containing protein [Pleomorphomonas sp. JP5]MCM5558971.1 cupin domain-containing protein [Pleomorphomonas sp. JP5]
MTPDAEARTFVSGALSPVGRARFSGIDADILLGGDMAPFTVMDMTVAPGMGAPAHISFHEEKVFHVAEGSFLFLLGEERVTVETGEHVYVAKGVTHGFSALGERPARMTLVSTPAHHERFFQALSDMAVPHDPRDVAAVCAAFDQAIVGPVVTP